MKIIILKEEGKDLRLQIEGEKHTLGNLIQNELLRDKKVDIAGYDVPHPLVDSVIIYIRTVGKSSPRKALIEALKRLHKRIDDLHNKFQELS